MRQFIYLTVTAFVLASFLALLALYPKLLPTPSQKYLRYNDVRGMAIEHSNLLFTLNFEQQNDLITSINSAIPHTHTQSTLPFGKIIVYRFGEPDIEIIPLGFHNNNLVFKANSWNKNEPLIEQTEGKLQKLLVQTYD